MADLGGGYAPAPSYWSNFFTYIFSEKPLDNEYFDYNENALLKRLPVYWK